MLDCEHDGLPERRAERRVVQLRGRQARALWRSGFRITSASQAPSSSRRSPSAFPTRMPISLQPRVRPPERVLHAVDPVRADLQQGGKADRRHAVAQQARGTRSITRTRAGYAPSPHRSRALSRTRSSSPTCRRCATTPRACCRACRTASSPSTSKAWRRRATRLGAASSDWRTGRRRETPAEIFRESEWLVERIERAGETEQATWRSMRRLAVDRPPSRRTSAFLPLRASDDSQLGTLVVVEDISNEKRVRSTLSRYMDPELADRLLADDSGGDLLGGAGSPRHGALQRHPGIHGAVRASSAPTPPSRCSTSTSSGWSSASSSTAACSTSSSATRSWRCSALPVPRDDDEDRALRAAISMIESLREWNVERSRRGDPVLDMGVGLNTGLRRRREHRQWQADGLHDHRRRRNLASRLEGACKHYGARILLSDLTKAKLRGVYRLREVDRIVVKGEERAGRDVRVPRLPRRRVVSEPARSRRDVQRRPREVQGG